MKFLRLLLLAFAVSTLGPAQTGPEATPQAPASDIIDINSASEARLKSIPGIGDAYAKKIVAGRPYRGKNELVSKKVLPESLYAKVKDRLVAKQR